MMEFIERSGPVIYAMAICSLGSTGGTPVARFKSYGSVEVMGRPWTSSLRSLCTLSIDQ